MITFMSGTPGSGKSLSASQQVEFFLKKMKRNVIANVKYNKNFILRGKPGGKFFYLDDVYFSPDFFYKYALKYHLRQKNIIEGQTLIVIDEAQILFSPTACKLFGQENPRYRQDWLEFFTQHRHLGFDVLIISQFDRLIDPQIRCLFEFNYVHRKINNFRTIGKLLTIFHLKAFIQVQYWYGCREKSGQKMFLYKKKYSKIYDSYSYKAVIVAKLVKKYGIEFVNQLLGVNQILEKKEVNKEKKENKKENKLVKL